MSSVSQTSDVLSVNIVLCAMFFLGISVREEMERKGVMERMEN
jgi:hypothetical protein